MHWSTGCQPVANQSTSRLRLNAPGPLGPSRVDSGPVPPVSIATVQRKLQAAGFDPGAIDGIWGDRTERALDAALAKARATGPALTPAAEVIRVSIDPGLAMLPSRMDTPEARVLMLAISGQEADFRHRWQVFDRARPEAMGAARGLFQFERGGGVRGVLTHERSRSYAADVCAERGVKPTMDAVYQALHADDVLAGAFARLLLWTDPRPLPAVGDVEAAWQTYLRNWRPGAYTNGNTRQRGELRAKWGGYYATAMTTAKGAR